MVLANLLFGFPILSAQNTTDWSRPADNYLKSDTMIARHNADNVFMVGYRYAFGSSRDRHFAVVFLKYDGEVYVTCKGGPL